ncbi:uncharacterized protein LOC131951492 [Physella acuta]|uniref:uncharacterized protein LOC131951492 n=1 Tax=Physella acuta TaxID=109671 RepID=UPI0027DBCEDD|nr:uncharacterized protein LOC131951492 [Physella acuta]
MNTRVIVLVLLKILHHICVCRGQTICPVAEEGQPYTLNCVGSLRKAGVPESFIRWKVKTNNQDFTITTCKADVKTCETNDKKTYSASNNIDTLNYNSTLRTLNVTREMNDAIFECELWDLRDNSHVFLSCRMAVYKKGDNTRCDVTSLDDGNLLLWCNITNVYPNVTCFYEETVAENYVGDGEMSCKTRRGNGLLNAYCQQIIRPRVIGEHSFKFKVVPGYAAKNVNDTAVIFTRKVYVTRIPQVTIEQPLIGNICPGNLTPITLTCKANLVNSAATVFELIVDGVETPSQRMSRTLDENRKLLEVTANFSLLVDTTYAGKSATCSVRYSDSALGENVIRGTKVLDLNWPPGVAPETYINGARVTGSYVTKGENLTAQCTVAGGHPFVSYTNLSCTGPNYTYTVGDFTNSVTLNIPGGATLKKLAMTCECYANHVTNCYRLKRIFKIVDRVEGTQDGWVEANTLTTLSYVIIGSVLLILAPFIIAICIFVCRHNKALYGLYLSKRGAHRYRLHRSRSTTKTPPGLPPPRIPPRPKPAADGDNLPRPHPGSHSSVTSDDDSGEWTEDEISISEPFNQSSRVLFSLSSAAAENNDYGNNNNNNIDYNNDYLEPLTAHPPPLPPRKTEPSPRFRPHDPTHVDQDTYQQDFLMTSLSDSPPPLPYRPPDLTSLSDCPPPLPYRPPDLVSMRSNPSSNFSRVNAPDSSDGTPGHESGHSESDASDGDVHRGHNAQTLQSRDVHRGHNAQASQGSQQQLKNVQDRDDSDTVLEMVSH